MWELIPFFIHASSHMQTGKSPLAYAIEMKEDEIKAMFFVYDKTLFKDQVTPE